MKEKESKRISELFEEIYNGDPWIGVSLMETLEHITAEAAAKKVSPQWNSIWEIVNHIIRWRETVLERVKGNITSTPDDNFFAAVGDQSEMAWQNTLQSLGNSQVEWVSYLDKMEDEKLEIIYPGNNGTYYQNIHGIIQHDAYHLGQIVLLAKSP